jgi:hypothetical protein
VTWTPNSCCNAPLLSCNESLLGCSGQLLAGNGHNDGDMLSSRLVIIHCKPATGHCKVVMACCKQLRLHSNGTTLESYVAMRRSGECGHAGCDVICRCRDALGFFKEEKRVC